MTPLAIARAIASQPTAPLLEHLPWRAVHAVAEEAGLPTAVDAVGNLVVGRGTELIMAAHLDHPAFVVDTVGAAGVTMTFHGGVRAGVAETGSPVVFHRAGDEMPTGRGVLSDVREEGERLRRATATVTDGVAEQGGFAVWDVTTYEEAGGTITARACDDLLGVAAAMAALVAAGPDRASLVCTRAEEIGLMGATEAVRLGTIPATAVVLSLECSKALPGAPQGGGVIVRVGDRSSIFDPRVTAAVWARAQAVGGLVAQRRLMDGGSCEATVFCAAGLAAAGLALPLAGYHNQNDDLAVAGPVAESVLIADYEAEVALLASLCADPPTLPPPGANRLDDLHVTARETPRVEPPVTVPLSSVAVPDGDDKQAVRMLADRLLVQIPTSEGERHHKSGLLIPAAEVSKRLVWAEVVAVGPNVRTVQAGDRVLFSPEDRYEVEVKGEDYLILREREIHAVADSRSDGSTGLYL